MSFWSRSWWVVSFCLTCCLVYFHFMSEKKAAVAHMTLKLEEMQQEKWRAIQKKEDLELRIASQNDPAWIEMILMRDLGVVPEGFLKVHFKK
ncbi:MAG: hypothetical protein COT85_03080 [Chlamydiae bacterium CG10_big_fil_rev_8_21_14_0_10_42_34]|nr:MAG: hypothetical protein COT85_03080 [Chlamydiae bacterium CG10_big_fil_rev_8_21_14_0_10_42_34]